VKGEPSLLEQPPDVLCTTMPMVVPVSSRRLVATGMGFSLHAGTGVLGNDREGLERHRLPPVTAPPRLGRPSVSRGDRDPCWRKDRLPAQHRAVLVFLLTLKIPHLPLRGRATMPTPSE
jgi:hypothetical protein